MSGSEQQGLPSEDESSSEEQSATEGQSASEAALPSEEPAAGEQSAPEAEAASTDREVRHHDTTRWTKVKIFLRACAVVIDYALKVVEIVTGVVLLLKAFGLM